MNWVTYPILSKGTDILAFENALWKVSISYFILIFISILMGPTRDDQTAKKIDNVGPTHLAVHVAAHVL